MKLLSRHSSAEAGYTLTELLVVIVVLALVAAAVTPQILNRFNSAKVRAASLQANTIAAAMDDFFVDVGRFPTADEGVSALLAPPAGASGWRGPYVRSERTLIDPWGNRFVVRPPATTSAPPTIASLGADGTEGGQGDNADVNSD